MPLVLVKFSKTIKGRLLLLILMIVITIYNKTGGIMIALLIIFLSEFNYEINNQVMFEGFENNNKIDDSEDEEAHPSSIDQLTIQENLTPKVASSQKVVHIDNTNNNE
jgi:hypothetical protein